MRPAKETEACPCWTMITLYSVPLSRNIGHRRQGNTESEGDAVLPTVAPPSKYPLSGGQSEDASHATTGGRRQGWSYPVWVLFPAALCIFFLAIPVIAVLARTPWGEFFQLIATQEACDALWLSVRTCVCSVIVAFLMGVPVAVVLARSPQRWWVRALRIMVLLPMVLPPVVAGLALLSAWGRMGLVGRHLNALGISIGFTSLAVIIAQVFVSLPFLIISLEGALHACGEAYEHTARSLGATPTRTFFLITLPMLRPGILSALALAFSRSLGEFGATITFAGSMQGVTRTMPLEIYLQREADTEQALALAVVLIALAVAMLALAHRAATQISGAGSLWGLIRVRRRIPVREGEPPGGEIPLSDAPHDLMPLSDAAHSDVHSQESGNLAPLAPPHTQAVYSEALPEQPVQAAHTPHVQAVQIAVDARVEQRGVHLRLMLKGGTVAAVMGANGAGKSTLLKLIAGTLQPSEGRVCFSTPDTAEGKGSVPTPEPAPRVVLLQQNPLLFPHLSVLGNVEFGLRAQGVPRAEARERALTELRCVGMEHLARRSATELSGGQSQRVAIARAMAIRPDIVLLDEPLAGLDKDTAQHIRRELKNRLHGAGVTCLFVTHDSADAEYLASEVVCLEGGRVASKKELG